LYWTEAENARVYRPDNSQMDVLILGSVTSDIIIRNCEMPFKAYFKSNGE